MKIKSFNEFSTQAPSVKEDETITKKIVYRNEDEKDDEAVPFENEEVDEEDGAEEIQMAMGELERIGDYAGMISNKIKTMPDLEAWVQSKITKAKDYMMTVHDYLDGVDGVKESVNEAKSITLITYGGKKTKYSNSDIDGFISNLNLSSEDLPGLIYKASLDNPNIISTNAKSYNKKKEAILKLLNKIKSHNGNVVIDVDSKNPSYKNMIKFESVNEAKFKVLASFGGYDLIEAPTEKDMIISKNGKKVGKLTKVSKYLKDDIKLFINMVKSDKVGESVNEAVNPSQVRSVISKVKKDLMIKWKQKGGYENFGNKEGEMLRKKFNFNPYGSSEEREVAQMIQDFENWASNYDGINEKVIQGKGVEDLNESTRWQVGTIDKKGNIESAYVHYDGSPDTVKPLLTKHYNDKKKIDSMMKLAKVAGVSYLAPEVGTAKQNFNDPDYNVSLFYGRDRGEKGKPWATGRGNASDVESYIKDMSNNSSADYVYLYDERDGKWYYASVDRFLSNYKDRGLKQL